MSFVQESTDMLSIFSKVRLSKPYALFAGLLPRREPLLAMIVQDSKILLQSQQAAGLFIRISFISILRMYPSFMTRTSRSDINVLVKEAK
jgi:hypothetical protein